MTPRARAATGALGLYCLLAILLFIASWRSPGLYSVGDGNDSPQFMWFLSWPAFALTHLHNPLLTNYVDYPNGVNLTWNASVPLAGAVLTPISLLFGPIVTYNLAATLALALSAWTAFIAIRRYVSSWIAAILGGLVYGFSPFMIAHSLGHPHVTLAFIPPLFLLLLDTILVRQPGSPWRPGLVLGLLAVAQLLIGEELLATSAIVGVIGIVILVGLQPSLVRTRAAYALRALGTAAVLLLVLGAIPLAIQFAGPQRVSGILQIPNLFVSDLLSFITPTRLQAIAPPLATRVSDRFTGDIAEWTSYLGIPLLLLLGYIVLRCWSHLQVRLAALVAVMLALLSLGPTLHLGGRVTHIPSFVVGLVFPLLAAVLPARVMLYTLLGGWVGLQRFPVLGNILPGRLMLYVYLFVGLLLAIFVEQVLAARRRTLLLGMAATLLALLPLLPSWPYVATAEAVPSFFTSREVRAIPEGSVALIAPFSHGNEAHAMLWQASSRMRFRMPEGYLFVPGPSQDPPMSVTQAAMVAIAAGADPPQVTDELRSHVLQDLDGWRIQTVIVGPMAYEQRMVEFFDAILGAAPADSGGVHVWWKIKESAQAR